MTLVERIAKALKGHRLDTFSQDSGSHCEGCKSDSRFQRGPDDPPWKNMDEHRAHVVMVVVEEFVREKNEKAWNAGWDGYLTDSLNPYSKK